MKYFKIKKIILLLAIINIGLMSACKKYLNVKSNGALVTPNSLKSFQQLLDDSNTMNFATNAFSEASADDYFILSTTYNSMTDPLRKTYTWTNNDYNAPNDWGRCYFPVYNANLILENITDIMKNSSNEKEWNAIKGSALFFRAHQFLTLTWSYGKAYNSSTAPLEYGIALRKTSDPTARSIRANLEESYYQIIQDLKESLTYLPLSSGHPMRPSLPAAYGLLARTYLSMSKYDSAYNYANKALDLRSELLDFNNAELVNSKAAFPFRRFNKETIFYSELPVASLGSLRQSSALIDTTLFESYGNDDLRKTAYFTVTPSTFMKFKGSYANSTTLFSGLATDEIYLIRAECLARMGKRQEALKDLNALLITRWKEGTFAPFETNSEKETIELILSERRKELIFRGLRWIDIKRTNLEFSNLTIRRVIDGVTFTLPPNDKRYALPLPADVIRLTGMPQNDF